MLWNKTDLHKLITSLWKSVGVAESCISSNKVSASIHISENEIYVQGPYGFAWAYINLKVNWKDFISVSEDFIKALNLCPEGEISIDRMDDKLMIRSGKAKAEAPILMEEIPVIPNMDFIESISIGEELWMSLHTASNFVSEASSKMEITGMYMGPEGMFGTNAVSVIFLDEKWCERPLTIPKVSFMAAQRIGETPSNLGILENGSIVWQWDNIGLLCPAVDLGAYPVDTLNRILYPPDITRAQQFTMDFSNDMEGLLGKVMSFSDSVTLIFSGNRLTVKAQEGGIRYSESLIGEFKGDPNLRAKFPVKELKKMCGSSIDWTFFIPNDDSASILFSHNPLRALVFEVLEE